MDPYKSISLPLGAAGMRVVHATLRRADGSMRKLSLELERSGTIEALLSGACTARIPGISRAHARQPRDEEDGRGGRIEEGTAGAEHCEDRQDFDAVPVAAQVS